MIKLWLSSCVFSLLHTARAALPFGVIDLESLKPTNNQISFDPLALLAILHNPRATASTARLYNQPSLRVFRWPHTMMIGGVLPPFKLLVDHLVSRGKSIHPATEMCTADTSKLEVFSDIGWIGELPFTKGNIWLSDLLAFKPSSKVQNDILIVNLESIQGVRAKNADGSIIKAGYEQAVLDLVSSTTCAMLAIGLVFSVLCGDMWATALFTFYLLHGIASIVVSFVGMVSVKDVGGRAPEPNTPLCHAVYPRAAGGRVVFKCRKETLEAWARLGWTYKNGTLRDILHWSWMLTGSLSAAASVICMVNMAGYLQLAYLGTLFISSLGEILVTQMVRKIENSAITYGSIAPPLTDNLYLSKAIIRSALEVDDEFSLAGLDWVELNQLPQALQFRNLCELLPRIRQANPTPTEADLLAELGKGVEAKWRFLPERFAKEILEALESRAAANDATGIKTV